MGYMQNAVSLRVKNKIVYMKVDEKKNKDVVYGNHGHGELFCARIGGWGPG